MSVLPKVTAYRVPRHPAPCDLVLDGNEGMTPPVGLFGALDAVDLLRRYPDARGVRERLARLYGVTPDQVLVTAGVDDALDRACRALLGPDRPLVLPVPTFEMLARYATLAGAPVREVAWDRGPYPVEEVVRAGADAGAIAVVSPNNPTGAVATEQDVRRLSASCPDAVVLLDHAYVEFADDDLTLDVMGLPNVLVFRTLSKGWGLAGLRVGCALGPPALLAALEAAGPPYPTAAPSLALAARWVDEGADSMRRFVARVRDERAALAARLSDLGLDVRPSQANFLLVDVPDALWCRDALAGLGIRIRAFPGSDRLSRSVRVSLPGDEAAFLRLARAFEVAYAPEAVLFDMDGVLADVRSSYREAIRRTAASFGVAVGPADISAAKAEGNANCDWKLTRLLVARGGVETALEEVTRRFEERYQGTDATPGLRETETLLVPAEWLHGLARRFRLGVVTGRPRSDAMRFLEKMGVSEAFSAVVCMEDAPAKPDPAPVRLALERLGVERAWLVGDTRDDLVAARGAGVLPIGVVVPGEDPEVLLRAGAARAFRRADELEALLPSQRPGEGRP